MPPTEDTARFAPLSPTRVVWNLSRKDRGTSSIVEVGGVLHRMRLDGRSSGTRFHQFAGMSTFSFTAFVAEFGSTLQSSRAYFAEFPCRSGVARTSGTIETLTKQ